MPALLIIIISFDLTRHSFRITLCLALNKSYMFFIHDKNFFLPSTVPAISGFPRLHLKARPTGFFCSFIGPFGSKFILILMIITYFTFHWKLFLNIFVSGEDDNYFIRIVLVERLHLNLPSSPCNPDPNYNFRACVYEKVVIHVF